MGQRAQATIPLRWGDFDALGHVNNAVFLSLLEIARDQVMREALGDAYLHMVIVRVEMDFRAEIPLGVSEVVVEAEVVDVGTSSVRTREQILLPGGTVSAESLSVSVVRDPETRRSRPWSEAERIALGSG
ncbi:MAG: acyl-CoA thioesterase [Candidatus Nanopelagicales bacterium]